MSRARADAATILRAAIAASDPSELVQHALGRAPELRDATRVQLIAAGKAACRMSSAATDVLGARVVSRLVVVPFGTVCAGALHAAHPVSDASSEAAGRAVVAAIERAPADALVLMLISGGASALLALPAGSISIDDYAACVTLLQRAGADIRELNTVRKHIDLLKGGRLALLAAPRPSLALLLSDVIGDPVDIIASGPVSPDPTTFDDAIAVLRSRAVWEQCPDTVRSTLLRGAAGLEPETPKHPPPLTHVRAEIIGGNELARAGAAEAAQRNGYRIVLLPEVITGEARAAAHRFAAHAREVQRTLTAAEAAVCVIAGGETSVTVRGTGRGGRNQEFVLAAALALEQVPGITIGAVGTDGVDGTSDAAGAAADAELIASARSRGIDPDSLLDDNSSHAFFRAAGGRIVTGPTGTNVMDVQVALVHHAAR